MSDEGPSPARRLGLTAAVLLGVLLIDRFPVPGIHPEVLVGLNPGPILNLFSFGLNPAVSAALMVEFAAFLVPRWRSLRHGTPVGRARLERAALLLTVLLASVQAFFIDRWLQSSASAYAGYGVLALVPETLGGRLVVASTIVTGAMIAVGLARLLDARGIGCGFSVLLAAFAGEKAVEDLAKFLAEHPTDQDVLQSLATPLLAIVGLAGATAWSRRLSGEPRQPTLPAPTSSVLPLTSAAFLVGIGPQLTIFGIMLPNALQLGDKLAAQAALLAVLTAAGAWLFSRPTLVAPIWRRAFDQEAVDLAGRTFRRGLLLSLVYLGVLGAAFMAIARTRVVLDALVLLTILCVVLDVATEWRFRREHGAVVRVWPEHRLYAVGPALARLEVAGIPAFARALRHRTLLAFVGPYVPVELLVPAPRAAEASALVESILGSEEPAQLLSPRFRPESFGIAPVRYQHLPGDARGSPEPAPAGVTNDHPTVDRVRGL